MSKNKDNYLTRKELLEVLEVNNELLIENMKEIFVTKSDLDENIKHLPTKEEFYSSQDELMKEIKDLRDEVTVNGHQVVRNTKRIEHLEKEVFGKIT